MEHLRENPEGSWCEWKGLARYYDLEVNGRRVPSAAWYFPLPTRIYEEMKGWIAFYPQHMDKCLVDGEEVTPQPGRLLRRLDHQRRGRPVQGGSGDGGVVTCDLCAGEG